jgi:hypothetical protein
VYEGPIPSNIGVNNDVLLVDFVVLLLYVNRDFFLVLVPSVGKRTDDQDCVQAVGNGG